MYLVITRFKEILMYRKSYSQWGDEVCVRIYHHCFSAIAALGVLELS